MAAPDLGILDEGASGPLAAEARGGLLPLLRRRPMVWGPLFAVVGLIAMVYSLEVMTADDGIPRYVVAMLALVLVYVGAELVAWRLFGPAFEFDLCLSIIWLVLIVGAAIFADLLPLAESRDVSKALTEPIYLRPDLFSSHPLGTDGQGLDVLGGIIYGARVSLTIGAGAIVVGVLAGVPVGIAAGYQRGKLDTGVSFLTDSMLAFPPLVFLLAVVAAFAPSIASVTIALAVLAIPTYIRLARANTLTFAQREFVLAARALGERNRTIMRRELLPNVILPIASFSFLLIAAFIVAEASLSFLGLSVSRPNPTWGNMIAAGQDRFDEDPHLVFVPGAILFLTVFSLNRVGDFARRKWDPRETKL